MSVTDWWLGEASQNSATVVCRSDATATVSVGINGQVFPGSADTSIGDGIVAILVTGLSPGGTYPYTIDGVAAGTLRTQDATVTEAWVGSGSCWIKTKEDILSAQLLADFDLDCMLALGDLPYANTASTAWGETPVSVISSVAAGQDPTTYHAHHRQQRRVPGLKDLMRNVPFLYGPDDHEYPFNDARKDDLAAYQADVTGAGSATQEDLNTAWAASREAMEAYATGFARGFDSDITPADPDALYCTYRIGNLVEIYWIDCINYADSLTAPDDGTKTMLGAAQYARLVDALNNSTATWKLIASGKPFWQGNRNGDGWNALDSSTGYEVEKAALLYNLRNVTGLLGVGGDQHMWSDMWVSPSELGTDMPAMSMLVGCPTTVAISGNSIDGYPEGVRTKLNGYPTALQAIQDNAVALFKFTTDRAYRYLMTTRNGLIACGYIDAGSNQVQYQRARIG